MNLFQIITLPLIGFLLFRTLSRLRRGVHPVFLSVIGVFMWILAGLAVARPEWTTLVARNLGIGRGADLVLYVVVIVFLAVCFYFYSRMARLESHITELVRFLSIQDGLARSGDRDRMHAKHVSRTTNEAAR